MADLFRPQKDRERATYGLKEAGIAKAYIGALGLDKHSRDAVRLIKWKQPTRENVSTFDLFARLIDLTGSCRNQQATSRVPFTKLWRLDPR